jgi:hypothetical protein
MQVTRLGNQHHSTKNSCNYSSNLGDVSRGHVFNALAIANFSAAVSNVKQTAIYATKKCTRALSWPSVRFPQVTKRVRNSSSHRRGDSQGFVNPGKIVMDEMERHGVTVILNLLAETIG